MNKDSLAKLLLLAMNTLDDCQFKPHEIVEITGDSLAEAEALVMIATEAKILAVDSQKVYTDDFWLEQLNNIK